jgi:hypothetical protein
MMDFMLGLGLRRLLLGLLFAAMGRLHGQRLDFHHQVTLAGKPLVLNQWTVLPGGLECKVDVMRWYVTPYLANRRQTRVGDAWLLDLADSASLHRQVYARKVDFAVWMLFGVDSLLQRGGVMDGDLDPVHGMYWTWQSGYIQFKLEGLLRDSAGERKLELHLGGFEGENKTSMASYGFFLDAIHGGKRPSKRNLGFVWALDSLLLNLGDELRVMSPSSAGRRYYSLVAEGIWVDDEISVSPRHRNVLNIVRRRNRRE